jgi:protein O-GlcNAc transferase
LAAAARRELAVAQAALRRGQPHDALARLVRLQAGHPTDCTVLANLAAARRACGDLPGALDALEATVTQPEAPAEAWFNYANLLRDLRRVPDAERAYGHALALQPALHQAHTNLANLLTGLGRTREAEDLHRLALATHPGSLPSLRALARLRFDAGDFTASEQLFAAALRLAPDHAETRLGLGVVLKEQGRTDAAITCWRQLLRSHPDYAAAHNNLGALLRLIRRPDEALHHLRIAVRIAPRDAMAAANLSHALIDVGQLREAEAVARGIVDADPGDAQGHLMLGFSQSYQGRIDDGLASFQRAHRCKPDSALVLSNALFASQYSARLNGIEIRDLHRQLASRIQPAGPPRNRWPNLRSADRPLRIGYLSPDLRSHPVSLFLEPILAHHDRQRVRTFCYSTTPAPDAMTSRLQAHAQHWRDCQAMSDMQIVDAIIADGIDILIDLAGHTAQNRAAVLRARPAPVQALYIGYPGTSGLPEVDHLITDARVCPAGSDPLYTERLVRLDGSFWCYGGHAGAPEPAQPPCIAAGHVTFGSFNALQKVSDPVVDCWGQLLASMPTARLVLKSLALADPATCEEVRRRFAAPRHRPASPGPAASVGHPCVAGRLSPPRHRAGPLPVQRGDHDLRCVVDGGAGRHSGGGAVLQPDGRKPLAQRRPAGSRRDRHRRLLQDGAATGRRPGPIGVATAIVALHRATIGPGRRRARGARAGRRPRFDVARMAGNEWLAGGTRIRLRGWARRGPDSQAGLQRSPWPDACYHWPVRICETRPAGAALAATSGVSIMTPPSKPANDELSHALGTLRNALVTVAVFSGFINVLMLAPSLYMLQVYDRVLGSRNETTLWVLTLLLLGVFLFSGALESVRAWVLVRVGARFDAVLNTRVFNATFERSLMQPGSNSAQPMHDLNTLRQTLTGPAVITLFDAPWMPIYVVAISLFSIELGLFALAGAVLLAVLAVVNERVSKPRLDAAQQLNAQSQMALVNHLRNAEVIEAMGMLPGCARAMAPPARKADRAAGRCQRPGRSRRRDHQVCPHHDAIAGAGYRRAAGAGQQTLARWHDRSIGAGEPGTGPRSRCSSATGSRSSLVVPPTPDLASCCAGHPERQYGMELPAPAGAVRMEGVSTAAPGSKALILKQISFAIQAGETIALIGPQRVWQVHAGTAAGWGLACAGGHGATGWRRPVPLEQGSTGPPHRVPSARHRTVRRYRGREHRQVRCAGPGACRRCSPSGRHARDDPATATGLRHALGGRRQCIVGWPKATRGPGTGAVWQPCARRPGRAQLQPR